MYEYISNVGEEKYVESIEKPLADTYVNPAANVLAKPLNSYRKSLV